MSYLPCHLCTACFAAPAATIAINVVTRYQRMRWFAWAVAKARDTCQSIGRMVKLACPQLLPRPVSFHPRFPKGWIGCVGCFCPQFGLLQRIRQRRHEARQIPALPMRRKPACATPMQVNYSLVVTILSGPSALKQFRRGRCSRSLRAHRV